jgi:hypothetical protein
MLFFHNIACLPCLNKVAPEIPLRQYANTTWTKQMMMDLLDERKIPFTKKLKKEQLLQLLGTYDRDHPIDVASLEMAGTYLATL